MYDYLRSVDCHPSAEEVYASVRQEIPNISLATVYKALEALVDCGLAAKLSNCDGPARYDHRSDAHYHLRCLRTDQVRDLQVPVFVAHGDWDTMIPPEHGRTLAQRNPLVTYVEVPGAGHMDVYQDPKFTDGMKAFLARAL